MWWKRNKWRVLVPVLILAVLAGAFWYGGGAPNMQGWTADREDSAAAEPTPAPAQTPPLQSTAPTELPEQGMPEIEPPQAEPTADEPEPESLPEPSGMEDRPGGVEGGTAGEPAYPGSEGMLLDPDTGKDQYQTDPVPEGRPLPVEPQDVEISDVAHTCTLSISCATIVEHMDWLDPEKAELVPEDGWILEPITVTFYEGESVFNVLQRTCRQQGIHMEFSNTPMYNSAYIEGIHNLYEFDCGELSGWVYKVNEWFPNYGCSRYQLQDGDVICWVYTCDLGADVGGFNAVGS